MSYGRELIQNLGCEVDTEVCMQNATVEAIVHNTYLHGPDVDGIWQVGEMIVEWLLSCPQAVDDSSFSSDPFLPGTPQDLLESGQFNTEVEFPALVLILSTSVKVEVILGTTKDEGIIWLLDPIKNNSLFEEHQKDWDKKWGPLLMGIHDLDEATDEDLSNSYKLLDFYIGGLENLNEDHLQSMFDMYTDSAMLFGVNRSQDINHYFESFIYFPSNAKDDSRRNILWSVESHFFPGQQSCCSLMV